MHRKITNARRPSCNRRNTSHPCASLHGRTKGGPEKRYSSMGDSGCRASPHARQAPDMVGTMRGAPVIIRTFLKTQPRKHTTEPWNYCRFPFHISFLVLRDNEPKRLYSSRRIRARGGDPYRMKPYFREKGALFFRKLVGRAPFQRNDAVHVSGIIFLRSSSAPLSYRAPKGSYPPSFASPAARSR